MKKQQYAVLSITPGFMSIIDEVVEYYTGGVEKIGYAKCFSTTPEDATLFDSKEQAQKIANKFNTPDACGECKVVKYSPDMI